MRLILSIVMTIVFSFCKACNKQDSNSLKSDLTYSEIINCVINSEQFDSIYIEKELLFDTSNGLINVDFEIKKKERNVNFSDNPHGFYLSIGHIWTDYQDAASIQIEMSDSQSNRWDVMNFNLRKINKKWTIVYYCGFNENGESIFVNPCRNQ